jgi:signal transduction histidine kinase
MKQVLDQLSLQSKIILVLISVIIPIFFIVTLIESQSTLPLLKEEIRQQGESLAESLSARVESSRLVLSSQSTAALEMMLQDLLFNQPDIIRAEIYSIDSHRQVLNSVATNVIEDEPVRQFPMTSTEDLRRSEFVKDGPSLGHWEIRMPIYHGMRDLKNQNKPIGMVYLSLSTHLAHRITGVLLRMQMVAACFTVVALILVLSYFLRKTIDNDHLLRLTRSKNLELSEQLHEVQRELMNSEKLAVMGQLTASFAHEIGTPLNAIGGHLQLLAEELDLDQDHPRLDIIQGQLNKIEFIVKSFLQSTAKPSSQRQLVDINQVIERTLSVVHPRVESLRVGLKSSLSLGLGPVRLVPVELEQVLLNVFNNSLDSLEKKSGSSARKIEIKTSASKVDSQEYAVISITDTGEGIKKADLQNVLKPFFSTKRPGKGTGLGLTICNDLVQKYSGQLWIDSKEGAWTQVKIYLPYHV